MIVYWVEGFTRKVDSKQKQIVSSFHILLSMHCSWDATQGGHLKLYPWPQQAIEIHPKHDRLVMFSSARMLHRVTPSYTNNDTHHGGDPAVSSKARANSRADQTLASMQHNRPASIDLQDLQIVSQLTSDVGNHMQNEVGGRCCFTIWLAQNAGRHRRNSSSNKPQLSSLQPSNHPSEDPDAAARFLLRPYVRPHVLKLVSMCLMYMAYVSAMLVCLAGMGVLHTHVCMNTVARLL
jgi:hypothetical protein